MCCNVACDDDSDELEDFYECCVQVGVGKL